MPVPGLNPNPHGLTEFTRFHRLPFVPTSRLQSRIVRPTMQEPGTIRRFWRAAARYVGGGNGQELNWTTNSFRGQATPTGPVTTRLCYAKTSVNTTWGGNQLSRPMLRPALQPSVAAAAPRTITSGNVQGRPVLRVRIPSFGSRVPALNSAGPGTQQ